MISIVMCSRDDSRFAAVSAQYAKALAGVEHEIVRIPDATGICEGYNRGIAQARGEWLLLSHDDIVILAPDFAANVAAHFQRFDLFGIAGTTKLVGPAWHNAGIPWVFGQVAYQQPSHTWVLVYGVPAAAAVPGAQAVDGVLIGATRDLCRAIRFVKRSPAGTCTILTSRIARTAPASSAALRATSASSTSARSAKTSTARRRSGRRRTFFTTSTNRPCRPSRPRGRKGRRGG